MPGRPRVSGSVREAYRDPARDRQDYAPRKTSTGFRVPPSHVPGVSGGARPSGWNLWNAEQNGPVAERVKDLLEHPKIRDKEPARQGINYWRSIANVRDRSRR